MYLEHFGLVTNPFALSPRLNFLFRTAPFEESMAHLVYGVENNEAITMITGAIGAGKTMAIQSFLSRLSDDFVFALVTNTRVDGKELLKLILEDFGLPLSPEMDKSDLLILFKDFLIKASQEGKRVLVVVDEAQNLGRDALEEIRLLTNLGQAEGQPVQVVLMGQPELLEVLNRDDLAQLRQRIRVHYHLDHLSEEEVRGYIEHRIQVAGGDPGVFTRAALDRVFELSGGVPRVVNTLAGDAMLAAFVDGRHKVEARDVSPARTETVSPNQPVEKFVVPAVVEPVTKPRSGAGTGERDSSLRGGKIEPDRPTRSRPAKKSGRNRGAAWAWSTVVTVMILAALWYFGVLDAGLAELRSMTSGVAIDAVEKPATIDPTSRESSGGLPDLSGDPQGTDSADTLAGDLRVLTPPSRTASSAPSSEDPGSGASADTGRDSTREETRGGPLQFVRTDSFRKVERAASAVSRWEKDGYKAFYRPVVINGQSWYRVYLGPFATVDQARQEADRLRETGRISYYVITQLGS